MRCVLALLQLQSSHCLTCISTELKPPVITAPPWNVTVQRRKILSSETVKNAGYFLDAVNEELYVEHF